MSRNEIIAYVMNKWPSALQSPVAVAIQDVTKDVRVDAMEHAFKCLAARDGWDIETLGFNIESSFPELLPEECDEIAAAALSRMERV